MLEDEETLSDETIAAGEAAALAVFAGIEPGDADPIAPPNPVESPPLDPASQDTLALEMAQDADALPESAEPEPIEAVAGDPAETVDDPSSDAIEDAGAIETEAVDAASAIEPASVVQSEVQSVPEMGLNDGGADVAPEPDESTLGATESIEPAEASPAAEAVDGSSFETAPTDEELAETPTCESEPVTPGPAEAAPAEAAPVETETAEAVASEPSGEPALSPEADPSPAMADAAESALPWQLRGDADPVEESVPNDAVEPQPPAVAFAPAFLAVDEEGQPVPDEAVEVIEAALQQPLPALAPVKLEPAGLLSTEEAEVEAVNQSNGGALWTIPLICLGIALIACCLLIPQADANRRLAWEREKLRRDLEHLQTQVEQNERFIEAMADDPLLVERLVQRQLHVVRAGTAVLELDAYARLMESSPFQLVTVPPPPPMPEYVPYGGRFAELCRQPKTQLYLIGSALLMIAAGLVLGRDSGPSSAPGTLDAAV